MKSCLLALYFESSSSFYLLCWWNWFSYNHLELFQMSFGFLRHVLTIVGSSCLFYFVLTLHYSPASKYTPDSSCIFSLPVWCRHFFKEALFLLLESGIRYDDWVATMYIVSSVILLQGVLNCQEETYVYIN